VCIYIYIYIIHTHARTHARTQTGSSTIALAGSAATSTATGRAGRRESGRRTFRDSIGSDGPSRAPEMFSIYAGPGWQIGLPGDTYEIILQVAAVTVLHSGGWLAVVMTVTR
jgi:hypothetical protein